MRREIEYSGRKFSISTNPYVHFSQNSSFLSASNRNRVLGIFLACSSHADWKNRLTLSRLSFFSVGIVHNPHLEREYFRWTRWEYSTSDDEGTSSDRILLLVWSLIFLYLWIGLVQVSQLRQIRCGLEELCPGNCRDEFTVRFWVIFTYLYLWLSRWRLGLFIPRYSLVQLTVRVRGMKWRILHPDNSIFVNNSNRCFLLQILLLWSPRFHRYSWAEEACIGRSGHHMGRNDRQY